jgi:hypothetical protein
MRHLFRVGHDLLLCRGSRSECYTSVNLAVATDAQRNHVARDVFATGRARVETVDCRLHLVVAAHLTGPQSKDLFQVRVSSADAGLPVDGSEVPETKAA